MKLFAFDRAGKSGIGYINGQNCRELLGYDSTNDLITKLSKVAPKDRMGVIEGLPAMDYEWMAEHLRAPIKVPVKDLLCVGLNYQSHVEESASLGKDEDRSLRHTTYFGKRCDYIRGTEEEVLLHVDLDEELDYEVELALIIGRGGQVKEGQDYRDFIFGFSVGNDFSSRKLQRSHKQWLLGKGLDGLTAMGPMIEVYTGGDIPVYELISRVNGQERQHSDTSCLITSLEKILKELTRGLTLVPGDIIFTGTPAGVGMGFDPPRYLKAGDVVEAEIVGLGVLKNRVVVSK